MLKLSETYIKVNVAPEKSSLLKTRQRTWLVFRSQGEGDPNGKGRATHESGIIQNMSSVDIMQLCFQPLKMSSHCSMSAKGHISFLVSAMTFSKVHQQAGAVCSTLGPTGCDLKECRCTCSVGSLKPYPKQ